MILFSKYCRVNHKRSGLSNDCGDVKVWDGGLRRLLDGPGREHARKIPHILVNHLSVKTGYYDTDCSSDAVDGMTWEVQMVSHHAVEVGTGAASSIKDNGAEEDVFAKTRYSMPVFVLFDVLDGVHGRVVVRGEWMR